MPFCCLYRVILIHEASEPALLFEAFFEDPATALDLYKVGGFFTGEHARDDNEGFFLVEAWQTMPCYLLFACDHIHDNEKVIICDSRHTFWEAKERFFLEAIV